MLLSTKWVDGILLLEYRFVKNGVNLLEPELFFKI